jgi:hypothetical protein
VLRPNAECSVGPASQGAHQSLPFGCEPNRRWVAVVLLVGQRAAPVEEFVSLHDVQAYPEPVARTVGASSEPLGSLSGIGRLAAQPLLRESQTGMRSTPRLVVSYSLERAGRILREDSRKESLLTEPLVRHRPVDRSLSMAVLTYR